MRFASFNVAFFGVDSQWQRDHDDLALLGQTIDSLDADVVAFQEIVDLPLFGSVLAGLSNRRYLTQDAEGNWLSSGLPTEMGTYDQKNVVAFDPNVLTLKSWSKVLGAFRRQPVAAQFEMVDSGRVLTVCGVHLESPSRLDDEQDKDYQRRQEECRGLGGWLTASGAFPASPGTAEVVVLGDFNGTIDGRIGNATGDGDPSLRELRSALIGWAWDVPSLPGGEWGWTTEIDEAVIDFILLSPSLVGVPRIHVLESRVSDHRPVVVDVEYVE